MLKKIVFSTLIIINASAYGQTCNYSWDLFSLGIKIGNSEDTVKINDKNISILSNFTPTDFLKNFNVHKIDRSINYDGQLNFVNKKEFYFKNKKEFKIEDNKDNIKVDNQTFEKKNSLSIDGTSFPYIYNIINHIGKELPKNVNILTKNKVIYGTIDVKTEHFATYSDNWSILVYFDQPHKTPNKIIINSGSQIVTANLKEKTCQNK